MNKVNVVSRQIIPQIYNAFVKKLDLTYCKSVTLKSLWVASTKKLLKITGTISWLTG